MKILILVLLLSLSLLSAEYAVVISGKNDIQSLSVKQIKDIFIMKRHFVNSKKIIPVNMSATSEVRYKFEEIILKINRDKLNNYWVKQHFQGIRPPVIQSSTNSMKLFIKNVDGAIGYLPRDLIDSDLRVIFEF